MTTIFRKWLEPVSGDNTSSFSSVDIDTLPWAGGKHRDVGLTLGACYKVITFDFDAGAKGRKKSLKKLAILQEALDTVKAELEKDQ